MPKTIPWNVTELKYSALGTQPIHLDMLKTVQFRATGWCPNCGELYVMCDRHITTAKNKETVRLSHGRIALYHPLTEDMPDDCDYVLSYEMGGTLFYPLPKITRSVGDTNQMFVIMASVSKMLLGRVAEAGGVPDETWGIIPNGGGDNYQWEIVEAFMVLGYLPPLDLCTLPDIKDRGEDRFDRWLIEGCKRATEAVVDRATRYRAKLNDFEARSI